MINKKIITLLCLLLSFLYQHQAEASNFHEHLFSLPFKENFFGLENKLFTPQLSIAVEDVIKYDSFWKTVAKKNWPHLTDRFINFKDASLEELYSASGMDNKKDFLLAILDFDTYLDLSKEEKRAAYQVSENLRKTILLNLDQEDFLKVFKRYFETELLVNRKVISATCTRRFFKDENKAQALQELAMKYGTELVYRCSIQRSAFVNQGVNDLPDYILSAINQRIILGIDIVASINETPQDHLEKEIQIIEKLEELFRFTQKNDLVLFMHAFEGTNQGPFYRAMQKALTNIKGPLYLEIGHSQWINTKWIKFLKSLPSVYTVFHCCPSSGVHLHDTDIAKLQSVSKEIRSHGFSLFLGSDGRGILPNSSFLEMQALIEEDFSIGKTSYLSKKGFPHIIQEVAEL